MSIKGFTRHDEGGEIVVGAIVSVNLDNMAGEDSDSWGSKS